MPEKCFWQYKESNDYVLYPRRSIYQNEQNKYLKNEKFKLNERNISIITIFMLCWLTDT